MKRILLLGLVLAILALSSCGSTKASHERRNLMMPRLSEMPKNSKKFNEAARKKRNKDYKKYKRR